MTCQRPDIIELAKVYGPRTKQDLAKYYNVSLPSVHKWLYLYDMDGQLWPWDDIILALCLHYKEHLSIAAIRDLFRDEYRNITIQQLAAVIYPFRSKISRKDHRAKDVFEYHKQRYLTREDQYDGIRQCYSLYSESTDKQRIQGVFKRKDTGASIGNSQWHDL